MLFVFQSVWIKNSYPPQWYNQMLDQLDRLFWNSASKLNLHTLIGEDEKEKKITRISRSTPDRREYKISSHSVKWERTVWFASEVIKLKFGFWPDHSSWFADKTLSLMSKVRDKEFSRRYIPLLKWNVSRGSGTFMKMNPSEEREIIPEWSLWAGQMLHPTELIRA